MPRPPGDVVEKHLAAAHRHLAAADRETVDSRPATRDPTCIRERYCRLAAPPRIDDHQIRP
jgi:hypothetical protein